MKVSRSPKLTPEKKQRTAHSPDDEVFEAEHHGDDKDHHGDRGDDDDEVILQIERDHQAGLSTTPPSKMIFLLKLILLILPIHQLDLLLFCLCKFTIIKCITMMIHNCVNQEYTGQSVIPISY